MTLPIAIAIVLLTIAVGSAAYIFVARRSPEGGRGERTPTSVYAVTAGAMSLLIAFTLSLTFEQYLSAQQSAASEAEAVMSMARASTFMDRSVGDPLRDQLVCYAEEVIDVSWPAVRSGDTRLQPELIATLGTMDGILAENADAAGPGLGLWETANQQRLAAHMQMLQIAGSGVPPILWLLLIFGSIITIGSLVVYADRSKPAWGHILVIVAPLFIASAALVVIAFFDRPYADTPGSITPRAMELTLERMTQNPIGDLPLPVCPPRS